MKAFWVALASAVAIAVLGFVFGAPSVKKLLWKHLPTVPTLLGYSPPRKLVSDLPSAAAPEPSAATKEHVRWKRHKKTLEALYEEGQSVIEHHWPEPDDREAQKHYRDWERRTADYLDGKLGKSYQIQFRGGDFPVKAAVATLLSPARLRNLVDERLEHLSEIIWSFRGPDAPVLVQPRMDGNSYVLVFHNRTGESRIFTAQVTLQSPQPVRGIRRGITYHPGWQGTGTNEIEIAHGEVANLVIGEREVLGSGDSQQIRFQFPWSTQDGEPTNAVTDLWKRGDTSPFRFKVRLVIPANPAYDGSPFSGCYRLEAFSFGATPC